MLFLTLETFSQTGGVQMASRSMTKALAALCDQENQPFQMLSLCDRTNDLPPAYFPKQTLRGFAYRKMVFSMAALTSAKLTGTVILAHINLLPLAWVINLLSPTTRIILIAHGKEVWGIMSQWKRRFLNSKIEIWAVSKFTKSKLVIEHRICRDRIKVLNNCLPPAFRIPECLAKPEPLLKAHNITASCPVLLTMTRMNLYEWDKGYDLVLESLPEVLSQFPELKYFLIGSISNAEQQRLRSKITTLDLEANVIITGFVSDEQLTAYHLMADIFVLPSSKEGFGLVFLEAAACGSKIIGGNRDGSVDALMEGQLGTLVNPFSKVEITAAIIKLLAEGPNEQKSTERQALLNRHFSFKQYRNNIKTLLNENISV